MASGIQTLHILHSWSRQREERRFPRQCDLGWSPFLSACGQDGIWAAHAALGLCSLLLEGPLAGPQGGALGTELLRRRPLKGSTIPAPQAQAASPEAAGPE